MIITFNLSYLTKSVKPDFLITVACNISTFLFEFIDKISVIIESITREPAVSIPPILKCLSLKMPHAPPLDH